MKSVPAYWAEVRAHFLFGAHGNAAKMAAPHTAATERGPPMQGWGGRLGGTPRPTTGGSRCCATTAEPRAVGECGRDGARPSHAGGGARRPAEPRAAVERRPYRMMIIVRTALGLARRSLPSSTVSEMMSA